MTPEEVWRTQQVKHSDYNNQDEGMSPIKSVYNYNFLFYSFQGLSDSCCWIHLY